MLENARRRFRFVWASALKLPTVIVTAAMTPARMGHGIDGAATMAAWAPRASWKKRTRTAKPAALGPIEKNAATMVGEPSYTSGAHMWKGTALILYAKPARMQAAP